MGETGKSQNLSVLLEELSHNSNYLRKKQSFYLVNKEPMIECRNLLPFCRVVFVAMAAAVYLLQRYTSGVADCSINIEDIQ